jgi:hypothetical protein
MSATSKVSRTILMGVVVWLLIAGVLVLYLWPHLPRTAVGWVVFVVVGPALYLLGELLFERLMSTRPARALAQHPSSGLRIFVGVLFGVVLLSLAIWLSWLLQV